MALLVLLLTLLAVNAALLLGWGVDTREPHNNWDPSAERRKPSRRHAGPAARR